MADASKIKAFIFERLAEGDGDSREGVFVACLEVEGLVLALVVEHAAEVQVADRTPNRSPVVAQRVVHRGV